MALGDPYALPGDLILRTGQADNGTYTAVLAAATRHVEDFTGRQFNKVTIASARKFRALDCERLAVDDFHTLADLVVSTNGLPWLASQFEVDPPDGVRGGVPGWPFEALFAVNRFWPLHDFRRKTITVTAQWGWATVPPAIKEATLDVAQVMLAGVGGDSGIATSESVPAYSVSYGVPGLGASQSNVPRALVKALPYRLTRFGVA